MHRRGPEKQPPARGPASPPGALGEAGSTGEAGRVHGSCAQQASFLALPCGAVSLWGGGTTHLTSVFLSVAQRDSGGTMGKPPRAREGGKRGALDGASRSGRVLAAPRERERTGSIGPRGGPGHRGLTLSHSLRAGEQAWGQGAGGRPPLGPEPGKAGSTGGTLATGDAGHRGRWPQGRSASGSLSPLCLRDPCTARRRRKSGARSWSRGGDAASSRSSRGTEGDRPGEGRRRSLLRPDRQAAAA